MEIRDPALVSFRQTDVIEVGIADERVAFEGHGPYCNASSWVPLFNQDRSGWHEQILLPRGFYPGLARAALEDQAYFTIDSEADLETEWPRILALRPDFIKTNLWFSEEFAQRK